MKLKNKLRLSITLLATSLLAPNNTMAQCSVSSSICTSGTAGPFNFVTPGVPVSTCLDFFGPSVGYIVLHITTSGPLNMLIDGSSTTGYIDVAVFNIPPGVAPCTAILNTSNQIGCNYASAPSGCNQFGTAFPCGSSVPAPMVTAGQDLIIVAENWSGSSSTFTLSLGPSPGAQTGPPNPTITPAGPFCVTGPSTQILASDMGGTWSGPGISASGMFNPAAAGIGTHTINYSIGTPPCNASATTTITVGSPTIGVSPSPTICSGTSTPLTATGAATYTWSPATGLSSTTGATVTASPTTTTTYTVTGATGSCVGSTTVTVNVNPSPVINVPSASKCASDPGVTLTASGATSYTWSPATGLSGTTGASVTANPAATTTYTITGTTGTCTGTTTTTLTVNPNPVIVVPPITICAGSSGTLNASGATSYTWSPATALSGTTGASVTANPAATTTYTITGTTGTCSGTGTVNVTVNPLPDLTIIPASNTICAGTSTSIALSSTTAGASFNWSATPTGVTGSGPGTGSTITQTLDATAAPGGTVNYTVTSSAAGCTSAPQSVTITVEEVAIISIDTIRALCNGSADGTITVNTVGGTQFSNNGGTSFQASNIFTCGAGTYPIEVENANGCSATGTAVITEPAVLTVPTSFTDETCFGACDGIAGTAPGGGTSPYSYAWSVGGSGSVPFLAGLCSGTYTVNVTDANGCTGSASINITGPLAVNITSTVPTQPTCNGSSNGSLEINAAGAATINYSINNGSSFQPGNMFTGLPAGTYQVMVKDPASGCQDIATVIIGQPLPLTVTANPDLTLCIGQSGTISAIANGGTTPYVYAWDNALPAGTSHSVSPGSTTTYNVTVTDGNGCGPVTDAVVVNYHPALSVNVSSDQNICPGQSASLSATASGGNGGPYTYTWTNNVDGTSATGSNQSMSPDASTVYTVTVTDGCGTPSATGNIAVTMFSSSVLNYTVDRTEGCSPVPVNFDYSAAGPGITCSWNFGDGSTGNGSHALHIFNTPGCYDISLTITNAAGCIADTTILGQICVYAVPVADFSFSPQPASVFAPEITFNNNTIAGDSYTWTFDSLGTSNAINPVFEFSGDTSGTYNVCLTAVNNYGCIDNICHEIVIQDEFLLYVPNAFTPDGNGTNDVFLPIIQGESPSTYEFYVFNRWGQIVFQTTKTGVGWDGTHNGIKAKEDVYVWKVKAKKRSNSEKKEYTGQINLLR